MKMTMHLFVSYQVILVYALHELTSSAAFVDDKLVNVWPLTDDFLTFEILHQQHGNYCQHGLNFNGTFPPLLGKPLQLDGDRFKYVDIPISDIDKFKSFGFVMFLKATTKFGCIFHYISNTITSAKITEVIACFKNHKVQFQIVSDAMMKTLPTLIEVNAGWSMLVISFNSVYGSGRYMSNVSGAFDSFTDSDLKEKPLGVPGNFRIGALHDNTHTSQIHAACVTITNSTAVTKSNVNEIISVCSSASIPGDIPSFPLRDCINATASPTLTDTWQTTTLNSLNTETSTSSSDTIPSSTYLSSESGLTETSNATPPTLPDQCTRTVSGHANHQKGCFRRFYGETKFDDSNSILSVLNVVSFLYCASTCLEDQRCQSFLFATEADKKYCTKYKDTEPVNRTFASSSTFYRLSCSC